ncbi:MAG: FAD-dependent oxidoreductase [Deltaproteobacteria bacterium]|nr:FAD-dependent oxidoreductase [Deltaproteobacteria bacterium]
MSIHFPTLTAARATAIIADRPAVAAEETAMSHTSMHARLRQTLQRAMTADRLARRTGVPADEWLAHGRSRRELLALMASAGALPWAACGAAASNAPAGPAQADATLAGDGGQSVDAKPIGDAAATQPGTVAIIGAGLAGLHCAVRLWRDYGIASTIYDGQKRAGGRCWTDRDTFKALDAMHCELGGELIDSNHKTMLALCKEFGLELLDYAKDDPDLETELLVVQGKIWTEKELLAAWQPLSSAIGAAQKRLPGGQMPTHDNPQGAQDVDKQSLAAWLDAQKVTGALRTLIDQTFIAEFGLDLDQQSALNLLDMVAPASDEIRLLGDSDERWHLKAGNDALVAKLVEALPVGALQLDHTLQKAAKGSDGRTNLTFAAPGGTVEVKADRAVFALPFSALRKVDATGLALPALKANSIAELSYGTNSKLMVGFKSRVWRKADSNGTIVTDLGFGLCWETSRLQSTTDLGILTHYPGGKKGVDHGLGTAANQRDAFLNQLDAILSGAKKAATADAVRQHWPSVPWIEGSYCCYKPGQFTTIRGAEAAAVGNVHFCGEHTDLVMQGYLEGAVASGARVAGEIATAWKSPKKSGV